MGDRQGLGVVVGAGVVVVVVVVSGQSVPVHGVGSAPGTCIAFAVCATTVAITKERTAGTAKPAIPSRRLTKCRRSGVILSRKPSRAYPRFIPLGSELRPDAGPLISLSVLSVNGAEIKIWVTCDFCSLARAGAASQLFVENCPSVKRCDSGFAEQVGAETISWWLRAVEAPSRKAREGAHPQFVNPNDHRHRAFYLAVADVGHPPGALLQIRLHRCRRKTRSAAYVIEKIGRPRGRFANFPVVSSSTGSNGLGNSWWNRDFATLTTS
jgi:hypothetical protein